MKLLQLLKELELPDLETGDELMVGKFKNRKATIKGFDKDKHNQPVAKTDKGDQQIFKGRVKKLMDESLNKISGTSEKSLMEKFAQQDVDNVSWFWAHPASGKIYHFDGSHTIAATDPNGPIAVDTGQFGGDSEIDIDDHRVFEEAFRKGWVRSMYIPDDGSGHPLGSQLGLHGPDEETVRQTHKMLVDKGLQVDHVGMRGHYDHFEYDEPQ